MGRKDKHFREIEIGLQVTRGCEKTLNVVRSCKTSEQLSNALNMCDLVDTTLTPLVLSLPKNSYVRILYSQYLKVISKTADLYLDRILAEEGYNPFYSSLKGPIQGNQP